MTTSEAQRRASAKWNAKNKERQHYYVAKSTAKRFIKKLATKEDLMMIADLLQQRQKELGFEEIQD
ncbi:MAG: hypothetical protein LKF01_01105 [Lactobacillus sp.]|jgi:hypothetical protein|nr:hypothetical protein [Lactobacillus sp.]MCH4068137.1 hypothetical protein [Lactobacillus sp.]MCI1304318.1 hypothetical protein [Lactobacillus sp.]MCI1330067.1 hypothetical protein [Lactobacillus sp.]MCI1359842.1 hypothetical protein [Lactobacillus sp.]